MLVHTDVELSELAKLGKNYNWQRPSGCPFCGNKLWGHGYISRYFNALPHFVYLKRYRCSSCKRTVTMFPNGYWKKYLHSALEVFEALYHRFNYYKWPFGFSRQKGGHWLRRYLSKIKMDYGLDNEGWSLVGRLEHLYSKEIGFLG